MYRKTTIVGFEITNSAYHRRDVALFWVALEYDLVLIQTQDSKQKPALQFIKDKESARN